MPDIIDPEEGIRVAGVQVTEQNPCVVHFDPYVPISFRVLGAPVPGARYIRFTNFETDLLELQFPSDSLTSSGFTLVVSGNAPSDPMVGNGSLEVGLPTFALPKGKVFLGARTPTIDIRSSVGLSYADADAQVDIKIGAADMFDRRIAYDRVQFLLLGDLLVGLRVANLSEVERAIFSDYLSNRTIPRFGTLPM